MSAVFFQDPFGLITFDAGFEHLAALAAAHRQEPRHPLPRRLSVRARPAARCAAAAAISTSLGGFVRRQAMLPVISDFLFDDADEVIKELSLLNVDARRVPRADRQRVRVRAAEGVGRLDRDRPTSRPAGREPSRDASMRSSPTAPREWQDERARDAKELDLDVGRHRAGPGEIGRRPQ